MTRLTRLSRAPGHRERSSIVGAPGHRKRSSVVRAPGYRERSSTKRFPPKKAQSLSIVTLVAVTICVKKGSNHVKCYKVIAEREVPTAAARDRRSNETWTDYGSDFG